MLDPHIVEEFLTGTRFAVVGAADRKDSFGRSVLHELRERGYDAVAVHPEAETVDGAPCYPDLASVPGELDGVIVMVKADAALDVVRDCVDLGIGRVWLFKGIGTPGAVSDEAIELCRATGIDVVPGACPLMFLEPVGFPHRVHRRLRRWNGSLAKASSPASLPSWPRSAPIDRPNMS